MVQARSRDRAGWLLATLAFVAPLAVVFAVSVLAFSEPITPEVVPRIVPSDKAIDLFVSLAQIMITMAVGIVVASLWLFRQPMKPRYRLFQALMLCLSMLVALVTFYAGLRFLYETGVQLSLMPFEFSLVRNRLYWEGGGLLIQVSTLCFNAVAHHHYRDRRHDPRRQE